MAKDTRRGRLQTHSNQRFWFRCCVDRLDPDRQNTSMLELKDPESSILVALESNIVVVSRIWQGKSLALVGCWFSDKCIWLQMQFFPPPKKPRVAGVVVASRAGFRNSC
jgi:hypothetical protein